MKSVISAATALLCLWPATPMACVDPLSAWSVGVVFSAGEQFDLSALEHAAADSSTVLASCIYKEAYRGAAIITSTAGGTVSPDPLTIKDITVSSNSLQIDVEYGGGCKEHRIDLYADGPVLTSEPGQIDLRLSHNANNDQCEALVRQTLQFDLSSLGITRRIKLRVYAPGAAEPDSRMPLWEPASGAKTKLCLYRFRSVSSPTTLAAAGNFDSPFQQAVIANRVVLVFDTASAPPTDHQKATAMEQELVRLRDIGVAALTASEIAKIKTALSADGAQYWTMQDSVLSFNMWFNGSSVSGVRGVYEANGAKGCGSGVSYDLPAKAFTPSTVLHSGASGAARRSEFRAATSGSVVRFTFPTPAEAGTQIILSDLAGHRVAVMPVADNSSFAAMPIPGGTAQRISAGCYLAALRSSKATIGTARVTVP
jgi:hypothetical protein